MNTRLVVAALAAVFSLAAFAGEPTALELVKEGNRYIGEQSKDKVVSIRSEKSVGTTTPQIWYVVYFDQTASLKAVEVKFGAGKMMDVKRPFRLLEPISGEDKMLNREKLKVDSDRAIKAALAEPLLERLKITATQVWLQRAAKSFAGEANDNDPVWKVRIWAQKLRHPNDDADVGEVFISAETGKVIKVDLHINRVD
jgi:hypothetical protein